MIAILAGSVRQASIYLDHIPPEQRRNYRIISERNYLIGTQWDGFITAGTWWTQPEEVLEEWELQRLIWERRINPSPVRHV